MKTAPGAFISPWELIYDRFLDAPHGQDNRPAPSGGDRCYHDFAGENTRIGPALAVSNRLTAPLLTIGSATGSLLSTIHLQGIQFADGIDTVRIDRAVLTWDP